MHLSTWLDPKHLLNTFGLAGVAAIVFAESGLLVGFFLPGDSLLFTAGILAAAGKLSFLLLLPIAFLAAAAGDSVGYAFGARAGSSVYRRPDSRVFRREHLERARDFYARRGASTIVLARFIPYVRTFAPIVAGAAKMPYRRFVAFNLLGALLWGVGVPTAGYTLGRTIPSIDRYLLPVIAMVVVASLLPIVWEAVRARRRARDRHSSDLPTR
ncbi:MAG TPA: VTT domain-containing protein [Actinomycetes bacterium]|nr:VTT domain-containing protein [Actinomycetes bacterium]